MQKSILVIGALGQIGSELTEALRERHGKDKVIASDVRELSSGQEFFEMHDCTDQKRTASLVKEYNIGTIYHLPAILSANAEANPQLAWHVNMNGLYSTLEVAREFNCKVFIPSSIAVFGEDTPLDLTPQNTIMRPSTIYGVTKVSGELLSDYYFKKYGVDTRGIRYPGLISYKTKPGGGTTDYAVEIYYEAIKKGHYTSYLKEGTYLDMMYMPDAIRATIELMEADPNQLIHRNAYNISGMSFDPEMLAESIRQHIPNFTLDYNIDPVKQEIADTWPDKLDDSIANGEWGWSPNYDLSSMSEEMIKALKANDSIIA